MAEGMWHCHGHEYDPSVQYIPYRLMWIFKYLPLKKVTSGNLRSSFISERFLMLANLVHARAILNLEEKIRNENLECKGVVLGHTHLPLHQVSPELLFLLNDGDMRHSSTFTIEDEQEFRQMTWDNGRSEWQIITVPRP